MALTPGLARSLEAAEIESAAAAKARWITRLRALMDAIDPALSTLELSVGLEVEAPPPMAATGPKRPRITVVGRWLSDASRHLRHVPEPHLGALFDKLEAGTAVLCVGRERGLDGLRPLVFCEPWEVARLGPDYDVVRFGARRDPAAATVMPLAAPPPPGVDFSGGAAVVVAAPPTIPSTPQPTTARREPPTVTIGAWRGPALGLGAMRLATADHPPADVGLALLRRAFDRGVRLVDTADSYGVDQADMHAGERLVRQAIASWPSSERDQILIATKAGLVRPGGRWLPDGRPEHLRAACEASLVALGVDAIPLWQLHVKDRKVPWEESLGALAALHREGKVRHLGLCNVTADDLHAALGLLPPGSLVSVQNALSPFEAAGGNEVLALCKRHRLVFFAHSALGGHRGAGRITRRPVFYRIADKHGVTPQAVVLAWLMTLGDHVVPLFGATRVESVDGSVQALALALDEADVRALDQAFPKAASLRTQAPPPEPVVDAAGAPVTLVSEPVPPPGTTPEVVVIMGIPGAGKSSLVAPYLEAGYLRLNRDELGGKLDDLIPPLRNALAGPSRRVVLDNTYPTRRQRAPIIEAAREAGVPVRLLWLDTPLDEARWNVARRIITRHGRLLGPEELAAAQRDDPGAIPPRAQATWIQSFEAPRLTEGFERIERRPFLRADGGGAVRGLLLDVDGTIRRTRSGEPYPRTPGDVELLPHRREILTRWQRDGWRLFFVSNQSGVHSGRVTRGVVDQAFRRTIELLGVPIDEVAYCPHQAHPVACFCRKPMPGLVTWLVTRHDLDRRLLTIVGDQPADVELARAVDARYVAAETFFGPAR